MIAHDTFRYCNSNYTAEEILSPEWSHRRIAFRYYYTYPVISQSIDFNCGRPHVWVTLTVALHCMICYERSRLKSITKGNRSRPLICVFYIFGNKLWLYPSFSLYRFESSSSASLHNRTSTWAPSTRITPRRRCKSFSATSPRNQPHNKLL